MHVYVQKCQNVINYDVKGHVNNWVEILVTPMKEKTDDLTLVK